MKRWKLVLASILVIIIIFGLIYSIPVLKQEDNTFFVLSGIVRLTFSKSDVVNYDNHDELSYYITKSKRGSEPIESLLEEEGWVLLEQMGAGYIFEKEGGTKQLTITSNQFTGRYRLWKVPIYDEE